MTTFDHATESWDASYRHRLVTIHRNLIRINTSNPPGNETAAARYVAAVLGGAGIATQVAGPPDVPQRCNVVARLPGTGRKRPLLLLSHLDVVPAEPEYWTHPPFDAVLDEQEVIWGRGAIDCKALVAQEVMTLLLIKEAGLVLDRDLILAATADEESSDPQGIQWLLAEHSEWLDAEFCLNEAGGEAFALAGHTFYPIEVGQKGVCPFRLTAHGRAGHGSAPHDDQAIVHLAQAIDRLAGTPLPEHLAATAEAFLRRVGHRLPLLEAAHPELACSLQRNTVVPTLLHAGSRINIIPGTAEAQFDCRILPGQTAEDVRAEICAVVCDLPVEVEALHYQPGLEFGGEDELYCLIEAILAEHDPEGSAIPFFSPASTDSYYVARHGMRVCGLTPLYPEPDIDYNEIVHGHDERIAVPNLVFGLRLLYDIVRRFCTAEESSAKG